MKALPSNVLVLIWSLEQHPDVVDNEGLSRLQINVEASLCVLLNRDLSSAFLGFDNEARRPCG
jgi:hypothetical protein